VAGLWSAPAAWRCPLPGLLLAQSLPDHQYTTPSESESAVCAVCGFRMEIAQTIEEWAYRLTDGTPLDGVPTGYAQALGWLGHLDVERPTPSVYDRWALGAIVAVLRGLPDGTRHAAAGKAIAAAKILRGPRTPGRVLEDLALIGVLAPADRPGLAERFTSYVERDLRPSGRVEVQAPLAWWSTSVGDHGVRRDVWDQLFVGLEIPEVDLDGPRPTPTPTAKETLDGALAARVRAFTPKEPKGVPSTGDGPVAPGDVWAVRLDPDRWITVHVHDVCEIDGRAYALAEYLSGVFQRQPTAAEISNQVQPRADGRWATWVHSLEKTSWVRRIAQASPPPFGEGSLPERPTRGSANDLRHLAGWCFA